MADTAHNWIGDVGEEAQEMEVDGYLKKKDLFIFILFLFYFYIFTFFRAEGFKFPELRALSSF